MQNNNIHIIAEAGSNHNGDINLAKNLIDIAARAGADSVKFQIINPWGLYLPGEYKYGHYDIKEVIKIREEGVMTDDEYKELAEYALKAPISFSASVFDEKGLDLLLELDPPYIKTASCDLNNILFLKKIAEKGKKMVVSTGMSSLGDIEKAVNAIYKTGMDDIVLLHCVSVYPASLEQINLPMIDTLKSAFGFPVGFSDHTAGSIAACMALAKGASWFEKHFTTDKSLRGFDHAHAQNEQEFVQYVQDIKGANQALSKPENKVSDQEAYTKKRARRSIYAARSIKAGETIAEEDLLIVRPEGYLDADFAESLLGAKVRNPIEKFQAFRLEDVIL